MATWRIEAFVWVGGAMCGGPQWRVLPEEFVTQAEAEAWWAKHQDEHFGPRSAEFPGVKFFEARYAD